MTAAAVIVLALLVLVLLLAAGVLAMLWRAAVNDLHQTEGLLRGKCAELDALSLAGPPITADGSHDRLPIRDDIRQMVTDYCEGIWHTPNGDVK